MDVHHKQGAGLGPMLIIFGGLPGVGKTAIAVELARLIGAVHLRIDSIEQGIRASGVAGGLDWLIFSHRLRRYCNESCFDGWQTTGSK